MPETGSRFTRGMGGPELVYGLPSQGSDERSIEIYAGREFLRVEPFNHYDTLKLADRSGLKPLQLVHLLARARRQFYSPIYGYLDYRQLMKTEQPSFDDTRWALQYLLGYRHAHEIPVMMTFSLVPSLYYAKECNKQRESIYQMPDARLFYFNYVRYVYTGNNQQLAGSEREVGEAFLYNCAQLVGSVLVKHPVKDCFLMRRREKPPFVDYWSLVGGHADSFSEPFTHAELTEETGLAVSSALRLQPMAAVDQMLIDRQGRLKRYFNTLWYLKLKQDELDKISDYDGEGDWVWLSREELRSPDTKLSAIASCALLIADTIDIRQATLEGIISLGWANRIYKSD